MIYLARICRHGEKDKLVLHLLAQQKSEYFWSLLRQDNVLIEAPDSLSVSEGVLVLVELSSEDEVVSIQDASDWVLELVEKYLTMGLTPEVLQQEAERIESWRQELTLQNQDVARRALEIETRRDQIQELEKKLELERKHIGSMKEDDGDRLEDIESLHGADGSSVQATTP